MHFNNIHWNFNLGTMNTGIDGHEHTLILHKYVNKKIPNFENLLKPYNTFICEYIMKFLYSFGTDFVDRPPPPTPSSLCLHPQVQKVFLAKAETLKHV